MKAEECIKKIKSHVQSIPEADEESRENPTIKELDDGLNEVMNIINDYEVPEQEGNNE